jgi:hypothetical protein
MRVRDTDDCLMNKRVCHDTVSNMEYDNESEDVTLYSESEDFEYDKESDSPVLDEMPIEQISPIKDRIICAYTMCEITTPKDTFYLTCGHGYHKNALKHLTLDSSGVLCRVPTDPSGFIPYFQCPTKGCPEGLAYVAESPESYMVDDIDDVDAFTQKNLSKMAMNRVCEMMRNVKNNMSTIDHWDHDSKSNVTIENHNIREANRQTILGPDGPCLHCRTCNQSGNGKHTYRLVRMSDGSERRVLTCK